MSNSNGNALPVVTLGKAIPYPPPPRGPLVTPITYTNSDDEKEYLYLRGKGSIHIDLSPFRLIGT